MKYTSNQVEEIVQSEMAAYYMDHTEKSKDAVAKENTPSTESANSAQGITKDDICSIFKEMSLNNRNDDRND